MTVAQLIAKLQRMPPDAPVMIEGYEGGIRELNPEGVALVSVELDVNAGSEYLGPHELADDGPVMAAALLSYDLSRYDWL